MNDPNRIITNGITFRVQRLRLASWFRDAKWIDCIAYPSVNGCYSSKVIAQETKERLILSDEITIRARINMQKLEFHDKEEAKHKANQAGTWVTVE
jgi:hypothetical protein